VVLAGTLAHQELGGKGARRKEGEVFDLGPHHIVIFFDCKHDNRLEMMIFCY
jgi:hypothetical protein